MPAGAKSSSLLFFSPSLKYSSKAEFGETALRGFLPALGGPVGVAAPGGGGGAEASVAGTRRSVDFEFDVVWYSEVPEG